VGIAHGCETFLDEHFFIDGKEFTPSLIVGQILEGSEFSFNWTSEIYAADSANTTGGSNVVPQLPLIKSTRHNLSGIIRGFNELECRNKLTVLRDNTTFKNCYIAMLAGYYPHFNRLQLENFENSLNEIGVSTLEPIAPSTATILGSSYDTAD